MSKKKRAKYKHSLLGRPLHGPLPGKSAMAAGLVLGGLSIEDAAKRLGLSKNTVNQTLVRWRKQGLVTTPRQFVGRGQTQNLGELFGVLGRKKLKALKTLASDGVQVEVKYSKDAIEGHAAPTSDVPLPTLLGLVVPDGAAGGVPVVGGVAPSH